MDYIKITVDRMFDLINLGNVTNPYAMKDILETPAVSDLLMEVTGSDRPNDVRCISRFRTDTDMNLNVRNLVYTVGDGSHKPVEDSMKEWITNCGVHMTCLKVWNEAGEIKRGTYPPTCMTVCKFGMAVNGDIGIDSIEDPTRYDRYVRCFCQFAYRAWLELNWLILNQPHTVHTGCAPADTIPAVRASDKKHKGRDKAKGRRRVYVRMLTLTGLDEALKEKERVREADRTSQTVPHEYTCPVWEVRGHVRHYRSGKTVYIAPYRKGKERDNPTAPTGKEYVLVGDEV